MNVVRVSPDCATTPGQAEGGDYKIIMFSFTNGDTPPDHDHD